MDRIEDGSLKTTRKRVAGQINETRVLQNDFKYLGGKDPIKDDKTISALLQQHLLGNKPDADSPPNKKDRKNSCTDQNVSCLYITFCLHLK